MTDRENKVETIDFFLMVRTWPFIYLSFSSYPSLDPVYDKRSYYYYIVVSVKSNYIATLYVYMQLLQSKLELAHSLCCPLQTCHSRTLHAHYTNTPTHPPTSSSTTFKYQTFVSNQQHTLTRKTLKTSNTYLLLLD